MSDSPWAALVPLAEREYELILAGRWDEAAAASSDTPSGTGTRRSAG